MSLSFTCAKCGRQLQPAAGGICQLCHRVLCARHLTRRGEPSPVCEDCAPERFPVRRWWHRLTDRKLLALSLVVALHAFVWPARYVAGVSNRLDSNPASSPLCPLPTSCLAPSRLSRAVEGVEGPAAAKHQAHPLAQALDDQMSGPLRAYVRMVRQYLAGGTVDSIIEVTTAWERTSLLAVTEELRRLVSGPMKSVAQRDEAVRLLEVAIVFHTDAGLVVWGKTGETYDATHWLVAADDADLVAADAEHREFARRWYNLVAAQAQKLFMFDEAALQLARGRHAFPDDPDLMLATGCMWETLALPFVPAGVFPGRARLNVEGPARSLEQAGQWMRQGIAKRSVFPEAHLHLSRVLLLRGDARAALAEARTASSQATETFVQYLAALFTGAAEEAMGQKAAAREAYLAAARFYPDAQTPHVAISHLLLNTGDRLAAADALGGTLSPIGGLIANPPDPWIDYRDGLSWRLPEMWKQLRREAGL